MDISTLDQKTWLWKLLTVIGIVLAVIPMGFCVFGNPLTCDESFYLSIMERVAEGKLLYKDVATGYTPLWFYMMAGLKLLFHIPAGCAEAYYVFHFLMQILAAFFLYQILRELDNDRRIAFFCSWLFVMMGHWMQGNLLDLEMSSIMFGLLSLLLVLKKTKQKGGWMGFGAGVAAACSFLCKQYGFGFFILAALLIIDLYRKDMVRLGMYVVGFAFPLIICLIIWRFDFVFSVLFHGYGTSIDESYGRSFGSKANSVAIAFMKLCFRAAIALLATLLFVPLSIREKKGWIVLFSWMGILGFLLQYWFAYGGWHYMLYTLPFVMILFSLSLSLLKQSSLWMRIVFLSLLSCVVCYSLYADYHNRIGKLYLHPEYKERQSDLANEIVKKVPDSATLWIPNSGLYFVHYLSNRVPPNLSTISYSFGDDGMTVENAWKQVKAADYVLSFDWDQAEPYYTKELKGFIFSHEMMYCDTVWDAVLHNMSRKDEE